MVYAAPAPVILVDTTGAPYAASGGGGGAGGAVSIAAMSTAGTPVGVTPSTTSQQLAGANANRRYGFIYNNSGVNVYLLLGGGSATTSAGGYFLMLTDGSAYELPAGLDTAIQVIAGSAGTGPVVFQEVTT